MEKLQERIAYKPSEVAVLVGLSDCQVRRMLVSGQLPGVRCGQRWLVPADALKSWLESLPKGGNSLVAAK